MFSSRVFCGDCGGFYGRKVWHSTDAYKTFIWRCNNKYKTGSRCTTPHVTEEKLKQVFVSAFNQRMDIKAETLEACRTAMAAICDVGALDAEVQTVTDEIAVLVELSKQLLDEYSHHAQNHEAYQHKHAALVEKYEAADARLKALQSERSRRIDMRKNIEWFMEAFANAKGLLSAFDEALFFAVTDVITVYHDGNMVVRFRDGVEVEIAEDKPAKRK